MLALGVVMSAPNDRATLSVGPSGRIVVSSSEGGPAIRCAGEMPRTRTTPIITVANGLAARSTRVEIHDASRFGPGLVDEGDGDDEIEIVVELGNDPDSRLAVMDDGPGGAAIRFGSAGINPNAFASRNAEPDADIFPIGVTDGALLGAGGAGPDSLGAPGRRGHGRSAQRSGAPVRARRSRQPRRRRRRRSALRRRGRRRAVGAGAATTRSSPASTATA